MLSSRNFKSLMAASVSICSAVCASQVSRAEGLKFDNLTGTLYVSGDNSCESIYIWKQLNDRSLVKSIIIGDDVEKIGKYSFYGFKNLKNIELSDSVTEIGEFAFYDCCSLSKIDLKNIKKIGNAAFTGCVNLGVVNMSNVEEIGSNAFVGCGFTSLTLPNNIKTIDSFTFALCNNLTTVICGEKEENIIVKKDAFYGCGKLASFINNKNNVEFDYEAFSKTPLQHLGGQLMSRW